MRESLRLDADLNQRRDFTGKRAKISIKRSLLWDLHCGCWIEGLLHIAAYGIDYVFVYICMERIIWTFST